MSKNTIGRGNCEAKYLEDEQLFEVTTTASSGIYVPIIEVLIDNGKAIKDDELIVRAKDILMNNLRLVMIGGAEYDLKHLIEKEIKKI